MTTVIITGTNFLAGPGNTVSFGGTAAIVTPQTTTQLTATSPAHAAGIVDITVITSACSTPSSTSPADQFTYTVATLHYSGSGTTLLGSGLSGPNGVAVDRSGNVYVADKLLD